MKFLFGSFFIFVFMRCIKADCANPKVDTVNVKTVLWRASDSYRVCWSKAEELLLYTRRVAQDLLPKKIPKDLSQTIHYLEIIWEAIQKFSPKISSSKEILRPAVADVLGGYLQSIALPMVNEGYYAGDVDYSVVKAFYDLYHRVKAFLDTDGRGWHKPCDMKEIPTRVSSFDYHLIPEESDRYACDELHIPQVSCEATTVCEKLKAIADPGTNVLPTKIALPFLDDEAEPTSVVIPFRDQYLFSLTSPASAHVLARYYNLAMRCIGKSDKDTLLAFNHAFYNWIVTYVAPHLHTPTHCHVETEWYPGFGSVMRILETMHQHGLTPGESRGRDYGIMSNSAIHKHGSGAGYHGFGKAITDIATGEGSGKFSVDGTLTYIKSVPYVGEMIDYDPILTLLGLIILLLILLCCIRNCCCADGNKRTGATGVCYTGLRKNPAEGNTTSGYSEKDRPPADYPSRPSAIYNSERVMNTSMLDDTTTDTSSPETYEKLASRKRKPRRKERALSRRNEKSCFSRR